MKIWKILRNMDKYMASIILLCMVAMVILQVTMRTVFSLPLIGPEELGRYFNICIVFLAAPYAARCGSHIRMKELLALLPQKIQRIVTFFILLSAGAVFGTIATAAIVTTVSNQGNVTPTLQMPFTLFFLPTMIGFSWLSLEYVGLLVKFFKDPDAAV